MQVLVRDNNVDQALKVLKKKMQREGVFRELKRKRYYEKPSERRAREASEGIRRARKVARKQAQREGLLPMPVKAVRARPARPAMLRPATSSPSTTASTPSSAPAAAAAPAVAAAPAAASS